MWSILSILCHFDAVRSGDVEHPAEGTSWNLVWGCSYMRWLNSLLRLTAAERGCLPPPLGWLSCLCNCTGSRSNLLIHGKTSLTEEVNSFLLSWRAALVYPCCQTGIQRWHRGMSEEQSRKEWAVWPQRDSALRSWAAFRWAQPFHVTVFNECPTQIILPASLPGALSKCPRSLSAWPLLRSPRVFQMWTLSHRANNFNTRYSTCCSGRKSFRIIHLCKRSFSPVCVSYLSSC